MSGLLLVIPWPPPTYRSYPTGWPFSVIARNPRHWDRMSMQLSSGRANPVLNFRGRYTLPYSGSATSGSAGNVTGLPSSQISWYACLPDFGARWSATARQSSVICRRVGSPSGAGQLMTFRFTSPHPPRVVTRHSLIPAIVAFRFAFSTPWNWMLCRVVNRRVPLPYRPARSSMTRYWSAVSRPPGSLSRIIIM